MYKQSVLQMLYDIKSNIFHSLHKDLRLLGNTANKLPKGKKPPVSCYITKQVNRKMHENSE